jgi:hypothetical protein
MNASQCGPDWARLQQYQNCQSAGTSIFANGIRQKPIYKLLILRVMVARVMIQLASKKLFQSNSLNQQ